MQVEALLDRLNGGRPMIDYVTDRLRQLGYASWAHRVINSAGMILNLTGVLTLGRSQYPLKAYSRMHSLSGCASCMVHLEESYRAKIC